MCICGGHFEFWPEISEAELFFRGSPSEINKYTTTIQYAKYGTFCRHVSIKSLRHPTIEAVVGFVYVAVGGA